MFQATFAFISSQFNFEPVALYASFSLNSGPFNLVSIVVGHLMDTQDRLATVSSFSVCWDGG